LLVTHRAYLSIALLAFPINSVAMSSSMQPSINVPELLRRNIRNAFDDLPGDAAVSRPNTWPAIRFWARTFVHHLVSL
jgi:hypothetical protein